MTNQEIIDAGQVIFDEESVGANTSERVGAVIKGIGQNLITEENARTSADTALGRRIDDEETARLAAESGLGGEIDNEIAARREADTSLGARIDREASARVAADAALGERIDGLSGDLDDEVRAREDAMSAEEAARQSGDDNLGDAISAETAARQQADTALDGRIDTEKAAREAADTALGGRIDTEKGAREAADTALGERIDDLSDGLDDEAEMRASAINDEKSAREQADIALGGRIDAEKAAREAADSELGTRITGLSDGLVAEVSAREAADINLQNSINLEAVTRESLDEKLDIRDHAGEKLATASVSGSGSSSFSVFYNFVAGHEYVIMIDIDAQTVSTIRAWGEGGTGKSTIAENATLMAGENYFKYTADEGAIRVNVNNVSGRTLTMSVYDYNSDVVNWLLDSIRSLPELAGNYTSSNRDSKVDAGVYANNSEQPGLLFVYYKYENIGEPPVRTLTAKVQYEIISGSTDLIMRRRIMDLTEVSPEWGEWSSASVIASITGLSSAVSELAERVSESIEAIGNLEDRVATLESEVVKESLSLIGEYTGTAAESTPPAKPPVNINLGTSLAKGKKYRFVISTSDNTSNSNIRPRLSNNTIVEPYIASDKEFGPTPQTYDYIPDVEGIVKLNINNLFSYCVVNLTIYQVEETSVQEQIDELDERVTALENEGGGGSGATMPQVVVNCTSPSSIEVYQRCGNTDRYLMLAVTLDHFNNTTKDSGAQDGAYKKVWRVTGGGSYKRSGSGQFSLIVPNLLYLAENEMAIQIKDAGYDSGQGVNRPLAGYHGYERFDKDDACYAKFYVDNELVSDLSGLAMKECSTFKYVQYSQIFDRQQNNWIGDNPNPIAWHLKETYFEKCGYRTRNTVTFSAVSYVTAFYEGLVCVGASCADHVIAPTGGVVSFGKILRTSGNVFDTPIGYMVDVDAIRPAPGSSRVHVPVGGGNYDVSVHSQDMWSEQNNISVHIESRTIEGYDSSDNWNFYNELRDVDTKFYRNSTSADGKKFVIGATCASEVSVKWDL